MARLYPKYDTRVHLNEKKIEKDVYKQGPVKLHKKHINFAFRILSNLHNLHIR